MGTNVPVRVADDIAALLATNPDKSAVVALAIKLEVPPSRRSTRAKAIEALEQIAMNERTHDIIARLALGVYK
jgi:hypothetical protein